MQEPRKERVFTHGDSELYLDGDRWYLGRDGTVVAVFPDTHDGRNGATVALYGGGGLDELRTPDPVKVVPPEGDLRGGRLPSQG